MNDERSLASGLPREVAEEYAKWFRCLADATRIQILQLLATSGEPLPVGEVTRHVGVSQSTVSAHLKRLADVEFVLVNRVGTASMYRLNPDCLTSFPTAAEAVMGRTA